MLMVILNKSTSDTWKANPRESRRIHSLHSVVRRILMNISSVWKVVLKLDYYGIWGWKQVRVEDLIFVNMSYRIIV
jgi:hypothetical protein